MRPGLCPHRAYSLARGVEGHMENAHNYRDVKIVICTKQAVCASLQARGEVSRTLEMTCEGQVGRLCGVEGDGQPH